MSDNVNPYQSPQADISPAASQGGLSERLVSYLREASPWLRFCGILTYIGAGILILVGIAMFIVPTFQPWGGISGILVGVFYIGCSLLVIFPARFTYNFGAKIRTYLQSNAPEDLELAFRNNKSLWKFYGILAIVYLALIPVFIAVGLIVAFTA